MELVLPEFTQDLIDSSHTVDIIVRLWLTRAMRELPLLTFACCRDWKPIRLLLLLILH